MGFRHQAPRDDPGLKTGRRLGGGPLAVGVPPSWQRAGRHEHAESLGTNCQTRPRVRCAPLERVDAGGVLQFRLGLLRADLVAFDPETAAERTLVALGEVLDDPSGDFIPSEGGVPLWYRLWASCGENLVRVHDRVRNQLRGFDASGTEVGPIDLPPVPFTEVRPRQFAGAVFELRQAELTGDVRARISEADRLRLLNQMAQGVSGSPQELASYLPRYVDFRCSEDGTMWMQPFDPDAGGLSGGPLWLRIAPDGATREVRLPDRLAYCIL